MRTHSLLIVAALVLGGCLGSPELPMLNDVELADDAPENGLVAADVEAPETVLQELQGVENVPEVPPVATEPEKPRRGLLGFFARRNRPTQGAPADVAVSDIVEENAAANNAVVAIDNTDAVNASVVASTDTKADVNSTVEASATVEPAPEIEAPRRGLRALFGKHNRNANVVAEDNEESPLAVTEVVPEEQIKAQDGSESGDDLVVASNEPAKAVRPRRERTGLFGPRRAKSSQFPPVKPGVVLPYGQIGLACGIRGNALGKEVDRFPERGKGYTLYDTNPSTTGPRTHYVTGFKDGCPRQFTASLALLDSPVLHEQLLSVGSPAGPHSLQADKAFQKIRAKVCRVGKGKPCPEKRAAQMEKSMAFLTTYERFDGNASWDEILLHNGVVAAH